jgi:MFS family permease
MTNTKSKHDPFAVLKVKEFLFFLNTRFFLTLAIQMQSVIVGWQVYKITGDVLDLGLIGLAEAIPFIAVSLFSGHVADVVSRKKIIIIATSFLTVSTSALLYFSLGTSTILLQHGTMPIFIVIGFTGIVRGFISASFPSFMSQLVSRDLYTNAATWNSTVWACSFYRWSGNGWIHLCGEFYSCIQSQHCINCDLYFFVFIH